MGLGHCAQDPPPAPAAVTHEHLKPEHPLEQPRPGPASRDARLRVRPCGVRGGLRDNSGSPSGSRREQPVIGEQRSSRRRHELTLRGTVRARVRSPSARQMPTPKRSLRARDPRGVPQSSDSVRGASATPRLDASRRLTSGAELSGARQRGPAGPPDRPRPSKRPGRKLDRLGIQPIRETTCQGAVSGRCDGIPVSRFDWRFKRGGTQGAGAARSRQEHGVDVSSDSSEPPTGPLHRLQGEPRPRTAHLAPEAGSG